MMNLAMTATATQGDENAIRKFQNEVSPEDNKQFNTIPDKYITK